MRKKWEDIKLILITHAHGDHIENLPKVLDLTGGPEVMLGEGDVETLYGARPESRRTWGWSRGTSSTPAAA